MKMILMLPAVIGLSPLLADNVIFKDGFENRTDNWKPSSSLVISKERSVEGQHSARVDKPGTVLSKAIPVDPHSRYRIRLNSYSTQRGTFNLSAELYDGDMKKLSIPEAFTTNEWLWDADRQKQKRNYWMPLWVGFDTGKNDAFVKIRIQKHKDGKLWLDDLVLEKVESWPRMLQDSAVSGPWTSESLMLPGPDGYLYPNFSGAGLSRPWTLPEKVFKVEDFGAVADDGKDDSDAIDKALAAAVNAKGGTILFGSGAYRLSRKISVRNDHIVFRGDGRDKTRLELGLPDNQVGIFTTGSDNHISPKGTVQIFFPAKGAEKVQVSAGNLKPQTFLPAQFEKLPDKEDFVKTVFNIESCFDQLGGEGSVMIHAKVFYAGGRVEKSSVPFVLNRNHRPDVYASSYITFIGRDLPAHKIMLADGVRRGDNVLTLENTDGIKVGELIEIHLPVNTPRWRPVNNNVPWWRTLDFRSEVASVDGKRVTLAQPLRYDIPSGEGAYACRVDPIKFSGIENMTISQVGEIQIELKMRTISFGNGWNCRAADLDIDRPGTSAVYGVRLKNCEFINCKFTQPWRTKLGGLAYTGWDRAWDCLISNVQTYAMRHAPLFNWSCAGNVVTGSFFDESDAQWHTGWCHDNLIENSRIVTTSSKFNSYGWAFFAVPADDAEHGGIGPRNVIYNCDSSAFRGGLHMGGYNRDWMVMYNRFHVTRGPGVVERLGGGANTFVGNVFILEDEKSPAFFLESVDSRDDRITGNTVYGGNGTLVAGPGCPAEENNNRVLPLEKKTGTTAPPVPSLYQWQREKYPRK